MRDSVQDDYYQAARQQDAHWWVRARRDIFARLLDEMVELPVDGRILDLGPGHGVNVPLLRDRGRLCVLDTDSRSLESSRQVGAGSLVQADATVLPFADQSIHLVTALDVLEHLDDDAACLAECRRVLRPEGGLLISVPALQTLWGRQDVLSEHRRRYGSRQLRERVTAAGFRIQRLSYFNTLLFPPILVVRLLMRPFLRNTVRNGRSDFAFPLPFGLNGLLYRMFAMEGRWLVRHNLPIGVSLLCLAVPEERRP